MSAWNGLPGELSRRPAERRYAEDDPQAALSAFGATTSSTWRGLQWLAGRVASAR